MATEKAKARVDTSGEELQRLLVAKEGESMKEAGLQSNGKSSAPGAAGKRAIKSLAKGGMLLKGKNPASVVYSGSSAFIIPILFPDPKTRRGCPWKDVPVLGCIPQSSNGNPDNKAGIFQLPITTDSACMSKKDAFDYLSP